MCTITPFCIRDRNTYEFWHLRRGCSEPSEYQGTATRISTLVLGQYWKRFFHEAEVRTWGCRCSPFYSLYQGRDCLSLFPLHRRHLNWTAPWSACTTAWSALPKAFLRELPPGAVSPVSPVPSEDALASFKVMSTL